MSQPEHIGPIIKRTLKKVRKQVYHPSEASEQMAVVAWARMMAPKHPQLNMLFAPNNGVPLSGPRRFAVVNWLKKMGMNVGVPDLMLPAPNEEYVGWAAEMKHKEWKGSLPDEEKEWAATLRFWGWYVESPCCGANTAIKSLKAYLGMDK